MIVTSTEIKNNFGKYIRLAAKEDIIITKNGRKVGRLAAYSDNSGDAGRERYGKSRRKGRGKRWFSQ